jgi:hypothetical protein
MTELTPDLEEAVAVVVGNFNPAIFHPAWLAAQGIVGPKEAENAQVLIVNPALTGLMVGAIHLEVTPERLHARTLDTSSYVVLRDFVVSVLTILEHTPVTAFGINRFLHFRVASEDEWHRIGHSLAPKSPWAGLLDEPGTKRVTMKGRRPGCTASEVHVGVEPSLKCHPGVFFEGNEHFDQPLGSTKATFVREGLLAHWDNSQMHFLHVAREILHRTRGS